MLTNPRARQTRHRWSCWGLFWASYNGCYFEIRKKKNWWWWQWWKTMQAKGIRVGEKQMKTGQVLIIINIGCGFICWCLKCLMHQVGISLKQFVCVRTYICYSRCLFAWGVMSGSHDYRPQDDITRSLRAYRKNIEDVDHGEWSYNACQHLGGSRCRNSENRDS